MIVTTMGPMKVFDYICNECNEAFERFVKDENEPVTCDVCGAQSCRRLIPTPSLRYLQMGVDPTMGTSSDKWEKARRQEMKREYKLGIANEEE